MPVDYAPKTLQYKVPKLPEAGPEVFFGDVLGNQSLTGSWFLLDGPSDSTPPKYPYDESGILVKGELKVKDETGKTVEVQPGDTFFIHKGSEITFSTPKFALAYKTSNRPVAKL